MTMAGLQHNVRRLGHFNLFLGMRFHVAIAPVYFAGITGSLTQASFVLAMIYVFAALFEVPTGILSDSIGRRRTVIAGAIASVVSVALYTLGASIWILLLGAMFEGLRRALISGNNEALLFESLKGSGTYATQLGRTESLLELALALCAPIGSAVAAWNLHAAVALGIIPQAACILIAWRIMEPPHATSGAGNTFRHIRDALRCFTQSRRLRLLTMSNALNYGLGEASFFFRPAFVATLWPIWALGIAQFITNIGTASSSWFAGRVIRRFGLVPSTLGASVLQRVIAIASLARPTVASPALLASIGFGYGVRNVGERTLLQEEFSDAQRATIGSLISLLGSIVLAAGLVTMGVIADHSSPAMAMLAAQVVLIVPTATYVVLVRPSQQQVTSAALSTITDDGR
jgi:MFS family permease